MDIRQHDSYTIDNLIVVSAASGGSLILTILLYFWLTASHDYPVPSDFLVVSLWSLAATIVTSSASFLFRRMFGRFPPSWFIVPLGSAFLFIFSQWIYLYWVTVSKYSPGDPFSREPPSFEAIIYSALWISALLSVLSICITFISYVTWLGREKEQKFDLTSVK